MDSRTTHKGKQNFGVETKPSITLLYHFFYPDDVVSARHFTQFAEGLRDCGWQVRILTSNRYCRYPKKTIPQSKELWNDIEIVRVYRPSFPQSKNYGRMLNTIWILFGWSWHLLFLKRTDVIVVGTDPQFAALIFPYIKIFRRSKVNVHWCFDVYPEAVIANGGNTVILALMSIAKKLMGFSYKFIDVMVDIGSCMRSILQKYNHKAEYHTLVPWALVEPKAIATPDTETRTQLFGSDATLTILYSGNMGKAHDFSQMLELARALRKRQAKIMFCFACRGNRYQDLVAQVTTEDTNIRFAGFADESELEKRLGCADIHLVSLRKSWTGIVVPSKFFGSIAVGKPIIFTGPCDSAIGKWIAQHKIGWVLGQHNVESIANELYSLQEKPDILRECSQRAYETHKQHFSRKSVIRKWNKLLRSKINQ